MRGLFTQNLGWKFLSLAVALGLWMTLVGEQELTTSTSVPLIFRNIPRELEISSEVPDRIHLEIQGPVGKLGNISNPAVILDLALVNKPGEQTFVIRQNNIALPSGVSLSRAVPGQIRLRFERRVAREVPVKARFAGPPPDGYRIAREDLKPSTIMVVGPESRVKTVDYAETDAIDLSQVVSESEFRVNTFVPDPLVRVADSQQISVRVVLEKLQQQ